MKEKTQAKMTEKERKKLHSDCQQSLFPQLQAEVARREKLKRGCK